MSDGGDHPREACGVFGVYGPGEDVARLTFYGLYSLQHRGQESAGIATSDGGPVRLRTGMGLVSHVFDEPDLARLQGHIAIGHTRYSTAGGSLARNAQPIVVRDRESGSEIAVAHNGNLVNADVLREDVAAMGVELHGTADTELIAHLLTLAPAGTWEERFHYVMRRVSGAYSLTIMTPDTLFAVRDPLGVRPLCLGKLGDGWIAASESCALEHLGATIEREVEPGEVVQIDAEGMRSFFPLGPSERVAGCTLEYVYFARPDSRLSGELIYLARERLGEELAHEQPAPPSADLVIGVPDSGIPAAIGFAREAGLPYRDGLVKNRYVGRTFIQPDQRIRDAGVALKLNAMKEVLDGRRVVVVDDSIVRGTTKPRVMDLLRRAGAEEVHVRIASPPIIAPCHLGVDMATRAELIAANNTVAEIREHIAADSLGYLSVEGMVRATRRPSDSLCNGCFTDRYPMDVQDQLPLVAPRADRELASTRPSRSG
ncbi:MAG: amidophosphoribosyltransferase [Dehalococcoidia bacterium]|nr:amidophosphoribosyltransferase [Chloroflexota bacterium]MXW24932.1 amidophosphoribosyltransferase [Dehalococcoidia bacterium]MYA53333.1 amidophosphoribosyltransferase [Dehalococcoidia bacterium]